MSEKWDKHFLGLAEYHSRLSKDPNTKVGAVIVGQDREIISAGFNGFPRGIADTEERLNDRNIKLSLTVHAELNAILSAARVGTKLRGSILYTTFPPCTRCAVEIIQAGIGEIVTQVMQIPERWEADLPVAKALLKEASIIYREIS